MKKALEVARDPLYSTFPAYFLALAHLMAEQIEEAEAALELSIRCQKTGFDIFIPLHQGLSGLLLVMKGEMGRGIRLIEEAARLHKERGEKGYAIVPQLFLGTVYGQMAIGGERPPLGVVIKNLGFLLKTLPFAARKAEFHLTALIAECRKYGLRGVLGQALLILGRVHHAKKRPDKARKCLAEAEGLFEQVGAEVFLRQTREALAAL